MGRSYYIGIEITRTVTKKNGVQMHVKGGTETTSGDNEAEVAAALDLIDAWNPLGRVHVDFPQDPLQGEKKRTI